MKLIHDGNNPGFFFHFTQERFDHLQEEGCAPHIVDEIQAQKIWNQLSEDYENMDGVFEIYLGNGKVEKYNG